MDRRNFVKHSCAVCLAAGAGMAMSTLSSCATSSLVYKTAVADNKVIVPVALFAQTDFLIIQPKDFYYNIGLRKEIGGTYTALLLRCTHADNQLTQAGNGFKCNLHGSSFNKEGQVTQGPAEKPLKRYVAEVVSGQIIIDLNNIL